jgi:UDP-N-acetylmuramoyl-tripeptide--D-alanyl-D-alanine ligase
MSGTLWTFDALLNATGGRPVGSAPAGIDGISIDSRTIRPGEAFFAIKGDRFDGHEFVARALAAGAATAVVSEEKLASLGRITGSMVVVGNVLAALGDLGRAARARTSAKIVAVTGSVGKTSTKDMLAHVLEAQGRVHASAASHNNHWGVPLTLSRLPLDADFGVFEIGMNHAGEITPLTAMVRPDVALITTVEPVHLEYFPNVEAIARAKGEIFSGVVAGGAAVLNRDNPHFVLLRDMALAAGILRIVGFGVHPEAEARAEAIELLPSQSEVTARIFGIRFAYAVGAPGAHIVQNSLGVLAAVALLGGDVEVAGEALATIEPPKGRGARSAIVIAGGRATLIDESYNANPASMRAGIAVLGQTGPGRGGRRIAVLGDMLELGASERALHAELAGPLEQAGADRVYLAGPRMEALWEALPPKVRGAYRQSAAELLPILAEELAAGDVIMIKGSNASRLGPLVADLKERFAPDKDERPERAARAGGKA